jgi:hypothetical protein
MWSDLLLTLIYWLGELSRVMVKNERGSEYVGGRAE